MKELALHILDIAQNAISAGAAHLTIQLALEEGGVLHVILTDDGRGMDEELLARVTDPFTTTRTTRKVGLGLPLLRMAAQQTGGEVRIFSRLGEGTRVEADFDTGHIDCPPLGDLPGVISLLVQGAPQLELSYLHQTPQGRFQFETGEVRAVLGPQVPLSAPEVALWIREYVQEGEESLSPTEKKEMLLHKEMKP